jgi:hypothetical protein
MPDPPKITEVKSDETSKAETTPVDKPTEIKTEAPAKTEPVSDDQQPKPVAENPQPIVSNPDPTPLAETKVSEPKTDPAANGLITKEAPIEQPVKEKPTANKSKTEPKPLFEPIIITVPDSRPRKSSDSVTTDKKDSAAPADKKPDGPAPAGELRPRVIDGQEVKSEEVPPCTVGVSQENISLINGGGNVGILVSVEAPGDIKSLTAISSSPKDIELTLEPEIGGVSDRRFYVIKSISSAVGVYQVTFAAPCGKRDVIVTVR